MISQSDDYRGILVTHVELCQALVELATRAKKLSIRMAAQDQTGALMDARTILWTFAIDVEEVLHKIANRN